MAVVVGTVVAVGVVGVAEQVTRVAVADLGKMVGLVGLVATVATVVMVAMAPTLVHLEGGQVAGTSIFASSRLKRSCLFSVKVTFARVVVEGGPMAVPRALEAAAAVGKEEKTGIRPAPVDRRVAAEETEATDTQDKRGHQDPKLRTGRKGQ
jgi:hypothetical protein